MIPNRGKRESKYKGRRLHYLAVKKLSTLLTGITFKHVNDFYFLIALIPLEKKLT